MPMVGTAEGPKIMGAKTLKELSTIVFYSLSYDFQKIGRGHQQPPAHPSARSCSAGPGWYHRFSSSPVTEGFRTMHPTLKPCYRALGTRGAGVDPPPLKYRKFKNKTSSKKRWITPYTFRFSDLPTALCC